jgi:prephenate dehydratase
VEAVLTCSTLFACGSLEALLSELPQLTIDMEQIINAMVGNNFFMKIFLIDCLFDHADC